MARQQLGRPPSVAFDTATKGYVDTAVSGLSGGGSGTSALTADSIDSYSDSRVNLQISAEGKLRAGMTTYETSYYSDAGDKWTLLARLPIPADWQDSGIIMSILGRDRGVGDIDSAIISVRAVKRGDQPLPDGSVTVLAHSGWLTAGRFAWVAVSPAPDNIATIELYVQLTPYLVLDYNAHTMSGAAWPQLVQLQPLLDSLPNRVSGTDIKYGKTVGSDVDESGWIDMHGAGIYDLSAPYNPNDAATKDYVDSRSSPLKVQAANPGLTAPGMWVQTYANGDISLWIEDGT